MTGKNSNNQRNSKGKTNGKKSKRNLQQQQSNNNNNSNSSNEYYSAVIKTPNTKEKLSNKTKSSSTKRTIHDISYASVQRTSPFPARGDNSKQIITTLINRVLTVFILIVVTYYILRGCDTTKTKNGQCTAFDPIKQDIDRILEHDKYRIHVEPYTDSMREWYDNWKVPDHVQKLQSVVEPYTGSIHEWYINWQVLDQAEKVQSVVEPFTGSIREWYDHWEVSDRAQKFQSVALDRATIALDRAKSLHAKTLDHAKDIQTVFAFYFNNDNNPTASDNDSDEDDYYSATMTPYETQLPHKEIQAILTAATQARTKLDDQLRRIQRQLLNRFNKKKTSVTVRQIGEEIKNDMEVLRKNAEQQVIQHVKAVQKTVDDETELTAIRQAERAGIVEVHKSDLLIHEIRLEIDQHIDAVSTRKARRR
ncbi:hypothetical protein INT45_000435 [Circinella minor]|uniref:Uncharacterized protein n=1 Tax=Circinella minor TaxID=1195481 RepID=A0A8H7VGK8_9FUNG|nr:hypothetical protein INT45_000435 [Circinella minor]